MTDSDPSLASRLAGELDVRLAAADAALAAGYPGERPGRQPVHTVYVPADRYAADLVPAYGGRRWRRSTSTRRRSRRSCRTTTLVTRVLAKLAEEPVEDLRVDFEDGYVGKSDADEDADVVRSARALAQSQQDGTAAPFGGIRIKCFEAPTRRPRPTHADGVRRHAGRGGRLAGRLGGDPAQGHQRRPGRGDGARGRDAGPALRGPGRDAAVDPRAGRHRPGRAHGARRRGAPDRPPLRHLRLLGVLRDRGGATSPSSTRSPTTPSW